MHTAVLPAEWRDRVVYWSSPSTDPSGTASTHYLPTSTPGSPP